MVQTNFSFANENLSFLLPARSLHWQMFFHLNLSNFEAIPLFSYSPFLFLEIDHQDQAWATYGPFVFL